jgi:hypothetical protein
MITPLNTTKPFWTSSYQARTNNGFLQSFTLVANSRQRVGVAPSLSYFVSPTSNPTPNDATLLDINFGGIAYHFPGDRFGSVAVVESPALRPACRGQ